MDRFPASAPPPPPAEVKLTIIIPVYNEVSTFPVLLEEVRSLRIAKEIIVVDNVSTDGTRELVAALAGQPETLPVLQTTNWGKGSSVRLGLALARGEYVVVQDADLEYDPHDILTLLGVAEHEGREAVFGSRLLGIRPQVPWHHALGRDLLNVLFRLLYGCKLTDVATCYKLLRTDVAQRLLLTSLGFDLDYELPCRLRRDGARIVESPVSYNPRSIEQGKKLRWTDGMVALRALLAALVRRRSVETGLRAGDQVTLTLPPFTGLPAQVVSLDPARDRAAVEFAHSGRTGRVVVPISSLGAAEAVEGLDTAVAV